jgi:hypothetical protein
MTMKTIKRMSTDWDIYSANVTIIGNLIVIGETTTVQSVDTLIYDNFITLAAGNTSGPNLNAGIEIDRGNLPRVGIRWSEEQVNWQYTNDGLSWKVFSRTILEEDSYPRLGGNLLVQDSGGTTWAITSVPNKHVVIYAGTDNVNLLPTITAPDESVVIGPSIKLPHITSDPPPVTGYNSIYAKEVETGKTGIFVSNGSNVGHELITKRKALIYSLIL